MLLHILIFVLLSYSLYGQQYTAIFSDSPLDHYSLGLEHYEREDYIQAAMEFKEADRLLGEHTVKITQMVLLSVLKTYSYDKPQYFDIYELWYYQYVWQNFENVDTEVNDEINDLANEILTHYNYYLSAVNGMQ